MEPTVVVKPIVAENADVAKREKKRLKEQQQKEVLVLKQMQIVDWVVANWKILCARDSFVVCNVNVSKYSAAQAIH
eukprot:gene11296-13346_t